MLFRSKLTHLSDLSAMKEDFEEHFYQFGGYQGYNRYAVRFVSKKKKEPPPTPSLTDLVETALPPEAFKDQLKLKTLTVEEKS